MDENFIVEVCARLTKAGIALPEQCVGCSAVEIKELEERFGVLFPQSYIAFLKAIGRKAGGFFQGTDIFYPEILENRAGAEELLEEDQSDFRLLQSDFVFAIHQGYQFMYFNTENSDDPPVSYYAEGKGLTQRRWETFSAYLLSATEDYEKIAANHS